MKNEELGCAITPHGNSSFFILNSTNYETYNHIRRWNGGLACGVIGR